MVTTPHTHTHTHTRTRAILDVHYLVEKVNAVYNTPVMPYTSKYYQNCGVMHF
jgi:hypothetical protein